MSGIKIMVLDRGFVLVGRVSVHPTLAFHWRLEPGRTIRVWGTSEGLAQLASGPVQGSTKLDPPAARSVPWRAVIDILDVDEDKWEAYL